MTIERPTDGFKGDMTQPPAGWPQTDEDLLRRQAEALTTVRTELSGVLDTWRGKKTSIFNPQGWIGGASSAAERRMEERIEKMDGLVTQLTNTIDFYNAAFDKTVAAKNEIVELTDAAQSQIDDLVAASEDDGQDRSADIQRVVDETYSKNSHVVTTAANGIDPAGGSLPERPPVFSGGSRSERETLNAESPQDAQEAPSRPHNPGTDAANATPPAAQNLAYKGSDTDNRPAPPTHANGADQYNPRDGHNKPPVSTESDGAPYIPTLPMSGGGEGKSAPSGGGSIGPASSGGGLGKSAGNNDLSQMMSNGKDAGQDQKPLTPLQQQERMLREVSEGLAKGQSQGQGLPLQQPQVSPASFEAPPAAPQVPIETPVAPPAASTAAPAGPGGGSSGGPAPVAPPPATSTPQPMPLGPPPTPPIAAPIGPGPGGGGSGGGGGGGGTANPGPHGPSVNPASTANSANAAVAPAPVPVSAARVERDTIAAASTADAIRRQRDGRNNALTYARRVAAALNVGVMDFGFLWVTGLCADGTIVVANSYGLAYIPAEVNLPPQVKMATADETIPPAERAKWATYPVLALQGWATAHGQKLRAVIATEAQFANFDPGAAKVVLQPDDIPESGKMEGRSRLEVIAPEAAARLATVPDTGLTELLPPANADTEAPADKSAMLWFELCKPLMSTMPDRGVAHLESFVTYADHAQELALHRAHTAANAVAQREAIADWVYWQHLSVLTADALGADVSV